MRRREALQESPRGPVDPTNQEELKELVPFKMGLKQVRLIIYNDASSTTLVLIQIIGLIYILESSVDV